MNEVLVLTLGMVVSFVLLLIALLHFYWAFGGKHLLTAVIPVSQHKPIFQPPAALTGLIATGLVVGAFFILIKSTWLEIFMPANLVDLGLTGMMLIFMARTIGDFHYVGLFKRIRDTSFAYWDTRIYSPLTLVLGTSIGLMLLLS